MAGTYHIPNVKRGDTFPAFAIATLTNTDIGDAVAVSSATMQVRKRSSSALLLEWSTAAGTITITGAGSNVVTLAEKSAEVMADISTGLHIYDLEVILTSGTQSITILEGNFPVDADVTIP